MKPATTFLPLSGAVAAVAVAVALFFGCAARPPDAPPPTAAGIDAVRIRAGRAFRDPSDATDTAPNSESSGRQFRAGAASNVATVVTRGRVAPEWLRDASGDFPPRRYLTAVGQGGDRRKAEDRARSEMARFFHSEIESHRQIHETIREQSGPDRFQTDHRTHSEEQLRVSTRKMLSGVWIARMHAMEPPGGLFYALAVLDRRQAAAVLTEKIRRLDSEIHKAMAVLEDQPDRLDQIRILQACLERDERRTAYAQERLILQPDSDRVESRISRHQLANRLTRILREDFLVAVAVAGSEQADRALIEALTEKGFAVAEQRSNAKLLARGTVAIEPEPQTGSTWKYVRWQARFELVDVTEQRIFASVTESGREGHLSYAKARQRALREIDARLAGEIAGRFDDFIRGKNP